MTEAPLIKHLGQGDFPKWDSFVRQCPEASFFHLGGWKPVIEEAFGHDCYFLFSEQNGAVTGILPLVHVRSRLFGNNLVSTGFTVGGGPVTTSNQVAVALEEQAKGLAERLNVDCIEFRGGNVVSEDWHAKDDLYSVFRREMKSDPEEEMLVIPRKQRAMVRKGIKAGLVSTVDEDCDRLHEIYAESVRNLGTPVFSRKYFSLLLETFGSEADIVTIENDGKAVASVMNFYFRDQVLPYYGGGTFDARALAANDFMYWEVMRRAIEKGMSVFDFGRSKAGTGAFSFKKNWGFTPEPLIYHYWLRTLDSIPEINPLNPKYRLFISGWKRLPLPVSKFIGPMISRNLG